MVRASRSQLPLSSGVVAAICPRICRPVRKSLRLKAASASVRKGRPRFGDRPGFALDLGFQLDRRIGQIVAFEGLIRRLRRDEAKRQRCAKCCGANQTNHDGAPCADERRVSNRSARKGDGLMAVGTKLRKSRMRHLSKRASCHAGGRLRRSIALRADRSQRPTAQALSRHTEKRFGTGLAGKRIFHIGNAMRKA